VLFIAAVREAFDDFRRHIADGIVNNASVCRLHKFRGKPAAEWKDAKCKDVTSGDILLLVSEDVVPADLILLSTSTPTGTVFVDTSSLDGEQSLKLRASCKPTRGIGYAPDSIANLIENEGGFEVECEEQTIDINYFKGTLTSKISGSSEVTQINRSNVLLRGEVLKNSKWCIGMVVFTGGDTKMARNSKIPKKKRSRLDVLVDWLMLVVLIVLLLLCTVSAVASRLWAVDNSTLYFYLPFLTTSQTSVREIWLTSLILLNGLLPISLYVEMELAQLVQASYIENDTSMFFKQEVEEGDDEKQGKTIVYKPEAHSSSLNSTLGMVGVVVTDKTGTLTQSKMKLRTILTAGETFTSSEKSFQNKRLSDILSDESDQSHREVRLALLTLALCHNVQVSQTQVVSTSNEGVDRTESPGKIKYEGASPDEVALVHAASLLGFEVIARDGESITIKEPRRTELQRYQILAVNEFDYTRKRMSVMVRGPDGHALLLVKGADSAIVPKVTNAAPTTAGQATGRRSSNGGGDSTSTPDGSSNAVRSSSKGRRRSSLVKTYNVIAGAIHAAGGHLPTPDAISSLSSEDSAATLSHRSIETPSKASVSSPRSVYKDNSSSRKPLRRDEFSRLHALQQALDLFATEGLRTLVLAYRECSESDVTRLLELREAAKGSSALLLAMNEMESNLSLAGATGVEDMLQEGVPETMRMLSRASIRVVMCTGDKTETAIATALSSCMLPPDCDLVLLKSKDRSTNISSLSAARASLVERSLWRPGSVNQSLALVIEGHTLDNLLVFDDDKRSLSMGDKHKVILNNIGAVSSFTSWLNRATRSMANLFGTEDEDIDSSQDSSSRGLTFFMIKARKNIVTAKTARKAAEAASALEKNVSPVEARQRLVEFMLQCRAVICSRMTPSQKADIVRLLQRSSKSQEDVLGNVQSAAMRHIVLSIGDGANDISMNQTADVSVGISGSNGRQALLASDYVIGQFRFLAPLLFVHGRTNYRRLALLSCYCVYKNIVLCLVLWGYTFYTGFSGTALFESFLGSLWSILFTSLPVIAVANFDEDVPAKFALAHPEIYSPGQHDSHFSTSIITAWLASAALHAFLIGITGANNLLGVSGGSLGGNGLDGGFILDGTALHAVLVATVMGKLALHTYKWTFLTSSSFILSGAFWLAFVYAYSAIDLTDNSSFYGVAEQLMQRYSFGFVLLLVPITALLTDFVVLHLLRIFSPTFTSIVQEMAALQSTDDPLTSSLEIPNSTLVTSATNPSSPAMQQHDVISVKGASGTLEADINTRVQSILLGSPLPQDNAQKALSAYGVNTVYASESSSSSSTSLGVAVTRVGVKGLVIDSDMVIAASAVHDAAFAEAEAGSEQKMAEDDHEFLVITLQRLTRQIRAEIKRKERRILQKVAQKSPTDPLHVQSTSSDVQVPKRRRISLTIRTLIGSSSSSTTEVQGLESGGLATIVSSSSGDDEEAAVMAASLSAPNVNTRRGGASLTPIKVNAEGIAASPGDGISMSPKTTPMAALRQLSRSISTRFNSPLATATSAIDEISAGASQVQIDEDFGDDEDAISDADSLGSTSRDDDFGELEGARSFGQLHNIGSTLSLSPGQGSSSRSGENVNDAPTFSRFTHSFADPIRERAFFRHFFVRKSTRLTRVSICMAIFFAAAYLFIDLNSSSFAQILVRSLILGGGVVLLFFSCLDVFKEPGFYSGIMLSVVIVAGIAKTLIIDADGFYGQTLYQMGIMLVLRLRFSHALTAGVIDLAIFIIFKAFSMPEDKALASLPSFFVYVVFCMVFVAISSLKLHAAMREDYLSESKLTLEERKGREMVAAMLPPHVVAALQSKQAQGKSSKASIDGKMKKQSSLSDLGTNLQVSITQEGEGVGGALAAELNFSEHEPSVTIVFVDIQDFKMLTAAMTPPLLVALLDRLWALLDALAEKYGITKLETVGKEYVACAGLNGSRSDHATACVAFAVNALRLLQLLRTSDGRQAVQVRIGINSGPVVAGIVGHVRPQFVLVGNTTNVSSRMSSTGLDNCVNLSQATYDRVRHKYKCVPRTINVKGKGVMTSYYVVGSADNPSISDRKSSSKTALLEDASSTCLTQPEASVSNAQTADSVAAASTEGVAEEQASKSSDILLNRILERKKEERERLAERLRRRAQTVALHPITYAFKSTTLEDRWAKSQLSASLPGIRRATILFAIYNLFRLADDLLLYNVARIRTSLIRRPTIFEISARLIMSVFLVLFFVLTYSQWYLSFEFPRPGSKRLLCLDHVKRFTRLRLHELLIAFSGILFVVSSVTPDEATLDLLLFFCVSSNSQAQSYISATTINLSVFALFVLIGETTNVYSEAISGEKVSLERSRYYFLIVGLVMCAFSQAAVEFYRRHRFAVSLLFSTEVGRNQELLYRMLPSAVVAQLLTGGGEHAAHEFSGVCILVCDVVSFTKLSSESSPVEVIAMLNGMFAGFERAAAKYKVFKVQTIGDAFVCVAGIPYVDGDADIVKQLEPGKVDPTVDSGTKKNDTLIMDLCTPQKSSNTNSIVSPLSSREIISSLASSTVKVHPEVQESDKVKRDNQESTLSTVSDQNTHVSDTSFPKLEWECLTPEAEALLPRNQVFAARMLRTAVEFVQISRTTFHPRTGEPINIRVGMHSGTVVGGVIGTRAFRFDVWGPDVLRANKYESGGVSGGINVSFETYDLLRSLQKHPRFFIPGLSFRAHTTDDVPAFIVSIEGVTLSQGTDE